MVGSGGGSEGLHLGRVPSQGNSGVFAEIARDCVSAAVEQGRLSGISFKFKHRGWADFAKMSLIQ